MKPIFHLDFETYSSADIKKLGAYRYANDPSTEILIFAIRKDDGPILLWDIVNGGDKALELFKEAIATDSNIYAHNSQFEHAISKYVLQRQLGIAPPAIEQWRCTAAMARRAAIPSSLAQCGEFLGFGKEFAKDKEGSRLIRKFSVPRKPTKKDPRVRIMPEDDPEDFAKFVDYCRQDVVAECEIHKRLAIFELSGPVLDSFLFDARMNDRGVPVNVPALEMTAEQIVAYEKELGEKFQKMTGFKHTQRGKALDWLVARGYPFDNLQKTQTDKVLENGPNGWETRYVSQGCINDAISYGDAIGEINPATVDREEIRATLPPKMQPVEMTQEAFDALKLRSMLSFAAVKKVHSMIAAACDDGRVRGALLWSGAERTHRWAGRIIQPQNFRRPTFKDTETAYGMLCQGLTFGDIEMLFGSYFEVVASCIRHYIQWPGGQLLQADYSSVEGRGAPWLCDGETKLQRFRDKVPVYETMAAKIFGCSVDKVVAAHKAGDSEMRFIGKQAELGCTYNMGPAKFRGTCEGFKYEPSAKMIAEFKPVYMARLSKATGCVSELRQMDSKGFKVNVKRVDGVPKSATLSVIAHRPGGTKRKIVDPQNPTTREWVDLTFDDLARRAVQSWREDNPEIVKAWRKIDAAAKQALREPGKVHHATSKISFAVTKKPGFQALILKLPSGHNLIYPRARLVWKCDEPDKTPDLSDNYNTNIEFWGKVPMKSTWGWCSTYGGKLLENATQAICGDLMGHGACVAEKHGIEAIMLVHDEMIALKTDDKTHEDLCRFLCDLPQWAKGFPLEAEGETIPFYKK